MPVALISIVTVRPAKAEGVVGRIAFYCEPPWLTVTFSINADA
jgi:hypothetical protein